MRDWQTRQSLVQVAACQFANFALRQTATQHDVKVAVRRALKAGASQRTIDRAIMSSLNGETFTKVTVFKREALV